MKFFLGFAAAIIIAAIAAAIFAFSYNVAAAVPETSFELGVLHSVMQHSVRERAGVGGAETWSDDELRKGFQEYDVMCVICHSAPGKERTPISQGMRPQPPNLADTVKQWTTAQLFWIVKNGVKMTGMPAFAASHSDDDIWNIVGFVRSLPQISADRFRAMENEFKSRGQHEEEAAHRH